MSKWINAEYEFNPRWKTFVVRHRDIGPGDWDILLSQKHPDVIQQMCELLIERHRPELRGCCILALGFDISSNAWDICISHPSLPEVQPYEACDKERLIP